MEKGKKIPITTVDQYHALQPAAARAGLEQIRQTIKKAAPQADELISYSMPAYKFHGMLAFYSCNKNHFGLYVIPQVLQVFKDKLAGYELSKATIKLSFDKPIPKKLITQIIKLGVKMNLEKALLKDAAKSKKKKKEK